MAELEPGAKVAKDLGIYLGQIYGYVKRGQVKNHKEGGYPEGKGLIVDPDEVKAAWMGSKKKGPRKGGSKVSKAHRATSDGAVGEEQRAGRKKLPAGTIVSYETGQPGAFTQPRAPRYNLAQVVGSNGRLTFLDSGSRRRHYNAAVIDNVVFGTDRLSTMLARGVAHIERPVHVLGMVIFALIAEGKVELASSLEAWMEANDLPVNVPEPIEMDDDADEPEAAVAVGSTDD